MDVPVPSLKTGTIAKRDGGIEPAAPFFHFLPGVWAWPRRRLSSEVNKASYFKRPFQPERVPSGCGPPSSDQQPGLIPTILEAE